MTENSRRYDVAIIGGGPAGAACAMKLASFGLSTALLDKGEHKRQHTGESLPSSIGVLLRALELELPASVMVERPPEHFVYWGAMQGGGRRPSAAETSLLVWRGAFDAFVREEAVSRGVVLLESAARSCTRTTEGHDIETTDDETVACRILVDASGRSGIVARRYRRREKAFRTLSLTAHYQTAESSPPTLVEAVADGWIWSAPVRGGLRDVTVMLDEPQDHRHIVDSSEHVRRLLGDAPVVGAVRGTDATPYSASRFCDRDLLLIGDAGSFLDPLSAHGVHKAMDSALVAAIVIRTILERPSMASDASAFFDTRETNIYEATTGRLERLYRQETRFGARPFWRKRSGTEETREPEPPKAPLRPQMRLRAGLGVSSSEAPVLEDDFIERRSVLVAPRAERPVRFLGGVSLPELFETVCREGSAAAAARASGLGFDEALRAIDWLYRAGYLDPDSSLVE